MANLDYYRSKIIDLRHHFEWIKHSLQRIGANHHDLKLWLENRHNTAHFILARADHLIQQDKVAYLPTIKRNHSFLENEFSEISIYIGLIQREGIYENKLSKLIRRIINELGYHSTDFLATFGIGAAVIPDVLHPIFYAKDNVLFNPLEWLSYYHEVGHLVINRNREAMIASLVQVVNEYFAKVKVGLGPVDVDTRQRIERAIDKAVDYWTLGINDIRLEELFCDCFATYAIGLPYLYSWLDFGVSWEVQPKFIKDNDEHPPFFARFEACWNILPEILKTTNYGKQLYQIWFDYSKSSPMNTNPALEYGTVCNTDLIVQLAEKSVELSKKYWPHLKQWDQSPPATEENIDNSASLSVLLNSLISHLMFDIHNYPSFRSKLIAHIFEA